MQRKPCKGGGRAWREQPQAKGCCSCQRPEGAKAGGPGGVWPGWHLRSEFWPPEQRIYFCCLMPVSASQQPQEMNTRTKHSEGTAPPTKHLLPGVSYCHMPRSTRSPSLPHAINRANHLELGNRRGASDPSFASKPLVHPPARQEVQSRAGAMLDHWWARITSLSQLVLAGRWSGAGGHPHGSCRTTRLRARLQQRCKWPVLCVVMRTHIGARLRFQSQALSLAVRPHTGHSTSLVSPGNTNRSITGNK